MAPGPRRRAGAPGTSSRPGGDRAGYLSGLSRRAGIGLRTEHEALIARGEGGIPDIAWLEIHGENYLGEGGARIAALRAIAGRLPVSCHCVGLSPGSADRPDPDHLARLAALFAWLDPVLVSDHLSWSVTGGAYLNDLLPLPCTEEALATVCRNVDIIQTAFGRRILIENPSAYLRLAASTIPEAEFMAALARRTGCGILLDVNNLVVSEANTGLDARGYLRAIPSDAIGEIHLAGHSRLEIGGTTMLVDDHGSRVPDAVWALYADAVALHGPRPTLVEWDTDLPPLDVLCGEAAKADAIQEDTAHAA